jgi:hypothetical protein
MVDVVSLFSNLHRCRGFALGQMNELDDVTFKRMFRVDRAMFDMLIASISPYFRNLNVTRARNSSGSPISITTRLGVTLRWLAGGSYLDLCFAWGISASTFYHENGVLWPTVEALDKAFPMGFPFGDEASLEELAEGFRVQSSGILDGCVMAIDGFGVSTRAPYKTEVESPKDYRFRKAGFAIIVLGGVDVKGKFICASCDHSGSTNDIIAWQDSNLYYALEVQKLLPERFFFIGDEAFTCTQQMLSPWPGRGLEPSKDAFNYWLSHSRQAVERGWGMVTQRWGIFWRIFRFAMDRWSLVIMVCMKLHNICVDRLVEVPTQRFLEDVREGDEWIVQDNEQPNDAELRGRAAGDRRRVITANIEAQGIIRPLHASGNSRAR